MSPKVYSVYILIGFLGQMVSTTGQEFSIGLQAILNAKRDCEINGELPPPLPRFTIKEGVTLKLTMKTNVYYINKAECKLDDEQQTLDLGKLLKINSDSQKTYIREFDSIITRNMSGLWSCTIYTNNNTQSIGEYYDANGNSYRTTRCLFHVNVEFNATEPNTKETGSWSDMKWVYIGSGVVLLSVIIVGQTCVIIYLSKARKRARLQRISQRTSVSNDDKKRYVTKTPGPLAKFSNKLSKNHNDDGEGLYETLEEMRGNLDTPPLPSTDTIPRLRREKSVDSLDITKRPRLPLPVEGDSGIPLNPIITERGLPAPPSQQSSPVPMRPHPKPMNLAPTSITNELENRIKLKKVPSNNPLPTPPKKLESAGFKRLSLFKKNSTESTHFHNFPSNSNATSKYEPPENPSPMPARKPAALLGLSPPAHPSTLPKPPPKVPPSTLAKPAPTNNQPRPTGSLPKYPATLPKHAANLPKPTGTFPNPTKTTPAEPAVFFKSSAGFPKPSEILAKQAGTLPKPTPSLPTESPTFPKPSEIMAKQAGNFLKPPGSLPKQAGSLPKQPESLPKQPGSLPKQPGSLSKQPGSLTKQPGSLPKQPGPLPKPTAGFPLAKPVPTASNPIAQRGFQLPASAVKPVPEPVPTPPVNIKPPLPSPAPTEEAIYEEYDQESIYEPLEEPVYNSDDEWTYEPLDKYNIYSS